MTEIKTWVKIKEKYSGYRFIFYNYGGVYFFEITDTKCWQDKLREIPNDYEQAVKIVESVIKLPNMTCSNCYYMPDAWRCSDCKFALCRECYIAKFYKNRGVISCNCGGIGQILVGKELDRKTNILAKHL